MKFNPITNQLFTDNNKLLKQLHCPLAQQWESLQDIQGDHRTCEHCAKAVYDTTLLTDAELQKLIIDNPHSCLKVDLNQHNLTITYHEQQQ